MNNSGKKQRETTQGPPRKKQKTKEDETVLLNRILQQEDIVEKKLFIAINLSDELYIAACKRKWGKAREYYESLISTLREYPSFVAMMRDLYRTEPYCCMDLLDSHPDKEDSEDDWADHEWYKILGFSSVSDETRLKFPSKGKQIPPCDVAKVLMTFYICDNFGMESALKDVIAYESDIADIVFVKNIPKRKGYNEKKVRIRVGKELGWTSSDSHIQIAEEREKKWREQFGEGCIVQ